ncbi:hypothetical protein Dsin_009311 [Dipteronia sinensis]|uniref:RNase H type-1 domain-containing protein n=1 Tax=Dipteronia sinensis TaxID=43782 RepID=A0AAE0AQE9_9ROSI|nr:hypothetical protein Dsin_009311 [Dipteronia sinensis]
MSWWKVECCSNGDIKGWWESRAGMVPSTKYLKVWEVLFFTVVWTVWEARNRAVFNAKEANVLQAIDMVKFWVAWWFKHHSKGSKETLTAILLNVKEICVDSKPIKRHMRTDWIPPTSTDLKFNVDGFALGKPGPAGIGGVLRDCDGKVLCMFSCYIGIHDSDTVKVIAIHKACVLYASNQTLANRNIEIIVLRNWAPRGGESLSIMAKRDEGCAAGCGWGVRFSLEFLLCVCLLACCLVGYTDDFFRDFVEDNSGIDIIRIEDSGKRDERSQKQCVEISKDLFSFLRIATIVVSWLLLKFSEEEDEDWLLLKEVEEFFESGCRFVRIVTQINLLDNQISRVARDALNMSGDGNVPTIVEQIAVLTAQMTATTERLRVLEAENVAVRTLNAELRAIIDGVPNNVAPTLPILVLNNEQNAEGATPSIKKTLHL